MGFKEAIEQELYANPGISNRKLAKTIGCDESTVRKHRKRMKREGLLPVDGRDAVFGIPTTAISERKRTVRYPDGSYDIIRFKPGAVDQTQLQTLVYDDLKDLCNVPAVELAEDTDQNQHEGKAQTLCVALSDFQMGGRDERGGSEETIKRVTSAYQQIQQDVINAGGYTEIILADLGDCLEGFGNTTAQAQTNDLSLTDQIRVVTRLYAEAIRVLAPYCNRLWFISVPSNHCQVRNGIGAKSRANTPDDDYGLLIHDFLKMWAGDRQALSHVQFVAPKKYEETLTLQTQDYSCISFTHGHLAGTKNRVADWYSNMTMGNRSGVNQSTILLHGHFHSFSISYTGDSKTIICAPSMDNGSTWFTNSSGHSSPSELLTFEIEGGFTKDWKLYRG